MHNAREISWLRRERCGNGDNGLAASLTPQSNRAAIEDASVGDRLWSDEQMEAHGYLECAHTTDACGEDGPSETEQLAMDAARYDEMYQDFLRREAVRAADQADRIIAEIDGCQQLATDKLRRPLTPNEAREIASRALITVLGQDYSWCAVCHTRIGESREAIAVKRGIGDGENYAWELIHHPELRDSVWDSCFARAKQGGQYVDMRFWGEPVDAADMEAVA